MIQVAYSNSNCSDLWDIFQKQTLKHSDIPLYMISDLEPNNLGLSGLHLYDNSEPYYKVWVDALKKFDSEYFIYLQEDFFLYSDINRDRINEYLEYLKNNPEYSFVRLINSGKLGNVKLTDTLYEIDSSNENVFAMQATLWRTSDYIKLMELVKDEKWLENDKYRTAMMNFNIKGVCHYENEPKRGLNHTDSSVYPYIATALVRGKWNMGEYNTELGGILNENNLNQNLRGIL